MKYSLITCALFLYITNVKAQKAELSKFLDAYTTSVFTESKKIIKEYSFNADIIYTMSEYNSISGLQFETDIPGINGYKAIINCKLENNANEFTDSRMLVIMYFDKKRNIWAVYSIREVIDPINEYNKAKNKVEQNIFFTLKESVYRNLAYWCLMAGKLKDARIYNDLSLTEAELNDTLSFVSDIERVLNAIQ